MIMTMIAKYPILIDTKTAKALFVGIRGNKQQETEKKLLVSCV
jgi:hypothetical protein